MSLLTYFATAANVKNGFICFSLPLSLSHSHTQKYTHAHHIISVQIFFRMGRHKSK